MAQSVSCITILTYDVAGRGQLSGIVEPLAGVIGAAAAMIFVVAEEVVPESQSSGNTDFATMGAMIGFAVMMIVDAAFGC